MAVLIAAAALGLVAGLRTLVPPAALAWAAYLGMLDLSTSPLFFLSHPVSVIVFTLLMVLELIADKLPSAPARTVPVQLLSRLASGAFCGSALALAGSAPPVAAAILGMAGAAIGAFAGRAARRRLAELFGQDRLAAVTEDVVALVSAASLIALSAR